MNTYRALRLRARPFEDLVSFNFAIILLQPLRLAHYHVPQPDNILSLHTPSQIPTISPTLIEKPRIMSLTTAVGDLAHHSSRQVRHHDAVRLNPAEGVYC